MKTLLATAAALSAALAAPAAAASFEGRWVNPKGNVVVELGRCGDAWCGTVVKASAKAKAGARRGGTENLIGTRILQGLKPAGNGTFKGQAFEPKRNIRAPATVRVVGPNSIDVKGCAIAGMLLCKTQRWTRAS